MSSVCFLQGTDVRLRSLFQLVHLNPSRHEQGPRSREQRQGKLQKHTWQNRQRGKRSAPGGLHDCLGQRFLSMSEAEMEDSLMEPLSNSEGPARRKPQITSRQISWGLVREIV